jgi:E3 ubiquitin-protein ligase RNF139
MSLWARLVASTDVLLRVPPLFVMDELLRMDLGLPQEDPYSKQDEDKQLYFSNQDSMLLENVLLTMVKFTLSLLGCLSALCVFILPKNNLTTVYRYLLSVGIMFVSYWTNVSTIKTVINNLESDEENQACILHSLLSWDLQTLLDWNGAAFAVVQNYVVQFVLGIIFLDIHLGPKNWLIQHLVVPSFMAPSLLALLPIPTSVLHHAPVFAALLPLGIVKVVLWFSAVQVSILFHRCAHGI